MKSERSLLLLFGALLAAMCAATVTVFVAKGWHHSVDSAIYILTSRSLAAGEGLTYLGRPFFVRPPGLPFVLQPFVGDPLDFETLNRIVQVGAALSFLAVALALRRVHRPLVAVLVALLFAINPLTIEAFNEVLAEFPYAVLFFVGAWLVSRCRDGRQPSLPRAVLGALVLGAACTFRTVGVLAIPGLVLADLFRRDGRRWQGLLLAAIVAATVAPWIVHGQRAAEQAERPSTQLLMFSYTTAMFHVDPRDPDSPEVDLDGWIARIEDNVASVGDALSHALFGTASQNDAELQATLGGRIALALVAFCVLFTLATRRSLLDWYLAAYGVLVLTYFTFVDRLLMPAMPLVLSAIVHTLLRALHLGADAATAARRERTALPLVAGWFLVVGAFGATGVIEREERDALNFGADRITARWLANNTHPDAVILHEKGPVIGLLSGRTTYTWRNLPDAWPRGAPQADWIAIGPRQAELEEAVAAAATMTIHLQVPWFQDRDAPVRIYKMAEDG